MNKNILIGILLVVIIVLGAIVFIPKEKNVTVSPINSKQGGSDTVNNPVAPTSQKATVKVYTEKDTVGERIVGSQGEQMILVATSDKPVSITYTISYKSAAVVPNAQIETYTETKTVSIPAGRTVLKTFIAMDGKVNVNYTVK